MKFLVNHYEGCGCGCGYYKERPKIPHKPREKKQGNCNDCKHLKWVLGLGMEPYCKIHKFTVPNHWTQWCYDYKRKWWKIWK